MRKILSLLSGILLVMAFVGSANAAVTETSRNCTGVSPNEQCIVIISCSNGNCVIIPPDPAVETNASCASVILGDPTTAEFVATHADGGPDPLCNWNVRDADNAIYSLTIDGSDGLPVELTTFSIE